MWRAPAPQRIDSGAGFDLYLCDLHHSPDAAEQAVLGAAERNKAARFVFQKDRRRYLSAHIQLRALLSAHCNVAPAKLEFAEGRYGKPSLRTLPSCAFNLSHSEDVAVILVAPDGEIGVDIEMLRPMPDAMAVARRNFSAVECRSLGAIDAARCEQAFLIGWTRKEACLKAIGSGLSIAPDTFTAGLQHDRCTTTIPTPEGLTTVSVQSFCYEERCVIAWAKVEPPSAG